MMLLAKSFPIFMLNTSFSPWPSPKRPTAGVRDVLLSNKVNYWTETECKAPESRLGL